MNAFTRLFLAQGHKLRINDIDHQKARSLAEKYDCSWSDSVSSAIRGVEMALLCTPIRATPGIIREASPHCGEGLILCEVASLKQRTVATLREVQETRVRPLSIHPMFGPETREVKGKTIVVVPVFDGDRETILAGSLFPGARILAVDEATHDRCMASILSLPYFMNLVFARVLPPGGIPLMRKMAGTTFTMQLALAESVVGEPPELIEALINENTFSKALMDRFIEESKHIRRLLNKPGEIRALRDGLMDVMMKDPEFQNTRKLRNKFFEATRS